MKDTITLPRLVVEQCMVACEINGWSTVAGTLQAALDAPVEAPDKYCVTHPDGECISTDPRCMHQVRKPPAEDPMLACDITPRPLQYPLSHYHLAIGGGPLHFSWKDKPHRLVYDLIAAVKYYAQQAAPRVEPPKPMFAVGVAERKWQSLQDDGYTMRQILFERDGRSGTIDPWGKVLWEDIEGPDVDPNLAKAMNEFARACIYGSQGDRVSAGEKLQKLFER